MRLKAPVSPIPPEFAVGRQVLVRGHEREGVRTITTHYSDIDGGVRLDQPIDGIFRSWNIDALIGETEWKMVERYEKARVEYEALAKEVETYFMPLVQAAVKRGDLEEAKSLRDRCPDHVTKCFIVDTLRQATQ